MVREKSADKCLWLKSLGKTEQPTTMYISINSVLSSNCRSKFSGDFPTLLAKYLKIKCTKLDQNS